MAGKRTAKPHRDSARARPGKGPAKPNRGAGGNKETQPSVRQGDAGTDRRPALVVGMGASAGGLDAFQRFFHAMPADSGMALIVIAHLDPRQKSAMAELIGRATSMPVVSVSQPVKIAANRIHVIAPGTTLRARGGKLIPGPRENNFAPIDDFFLSLAEDCGDRAVAIVLSGTGKDGTLGVKAVKEAGGLTIAQASESAQYPGMPRSAVATGLVDLVLPVEQMPGKLVDHARRVDRLADGGTESELQEELRDYLVNICTLLRAKTGHDFSQYKESTLLRRVQRRMQVLQLEKVASYVERLRKDGAEPELLFQDLLIGVTHFFRDRDAFAALEGKVIPKLFENRVDDTIRVWVPGCATGEEAYSIAILLRERMEKAEAEPRVQIFATDIDDKALEFARQGIYPDTIARDVSPQRLKRFFAPRGDMRQVAKEVREMCVFSVHNLTKDPPFSRLDLVSCRNLLIYMNARLQGRILPLFHFALRPGRFLFLGPSENITQHSRFFAVVDSKRRIFRATSSVAPLLPAMPLHDAPDRVPSARLEPGTARTAARRTLVASVDRMLLSAFVPAHVVVNERFDLLYSSAGTGKYLELPAGAPNANLVNLARKGLRLELRAALTKAQQGGRKVVQNDVVIGVNGGTQAIRLVVQPLPDADDAGSHFLVLFEDIGPAQPVPEAKPGQRKAANERRLVHQLEAELRGTQDRLQTTIEELESSNEELKSSNEEFQSMNEELQSSNEELETSREELQSVNEELETVNSELTSKMEALDRVNGDIRNLLESTQIATIFLTGECRIRTFTPMAKEIFHLIDSDVGRPITDIVTRLAYAALEEDVGKVMRTLAPIEKEVELPGARSTFIMRVLPYRTLDNVLDGVVITFVDVSERKRLEADRSALGNIVTSSHDAIIGVALDGAITSWNASAERMLRYPAREAIGRRWTLLFAPERLLEEERLFEGAKRDEPARLHDTFFAAADGRLVPVSLTVSVNKDLGGRIVGASLIARDITERRQAEERQRLLLAELNHRVKNTLATVLSVAHQTLADSESVGDFRQAFTGRIRALSATQNLLTRTNWTGVTLRDIIEAETAAHVKRKGENFRLVGPDLLLTPRAALALALLVHELATNATRHGALSRPAGVVDIAWEIAGTGDGRKLKLKWTESGGPKVRAPARRGFGRRLIEEGLAYEFDGKAELDFAADGLTCMIELPVADAVVDEHSRS